tara:strand:- start:1920 stop:2036 length:117 start_codon:yes stop_codon:yes gene_type:complete
VLIESVNFNTPKRYQKEFLGQLVAILDLTMTKTKSDHI